jgi:hypothetical protein
MNPLRTEHSLDWSVPAGTLFLTPTGYIPIELLKVGDVAIGFDEHTLEPIIATVTATFKYKNRTSSEMTHRHEIE